jgi:hypothetical protein
LNFQRIFLTNIYCSVGIVSFFSRGVFLQFCRPIYCDLRTRQHRHIGQNITSLPETNVGVCSSQKKMKAHTTTKRQKKVVNLFFFGDDMNFNKIKNRFSPFEWMFRLQRLNLFFPPRNVNFCQRFFSTSRRSTYCIAQLSYNSTLQCHQT